MADTTSIKWEVLETSSEAIAKDQFLKALDIWNNNPRVVNRRIHSTVPLLKAEVSNDLNIDVIVSNLLCLETDVSDLSPEDFTNLLEKHGLIISKSQEIDNMEIYIKKHLPKSCKHFSTSFELVIIDQSNAWALFYGFPVHQGFSVVPNFPYKLYYKSSIMVEVPHKEAKDPSSLWLRNNLLPQLQKWSLSCKSEDDSETQVSALPVKSHTLISTEKYAELYQTLKTKYGPEIVKIWPECTDPAKFVYEDIAIATYILLLWGEEKPVSFVDVGCGNGLLVHLLNSEGHNGVGVDVRSRKIWNLYPETTKLKVETVVPSDDSLFPDVDWVIGNHSDELTPWIPVIAARSSQTCKFFVLPCCPYDFDGFKYRRQNASMSQYSDFLIYLKKVSERCGFETFFDRMRIPSTKRICLVGQARTYLPDEWDSVNLTINQLIEDGCRDKFDWGETEEGMKKKSCGDKGWVPDYKPREATEKVRNCTQLNENLISDIVSLTARHLLIKRRLVLHPQNPDKSWNAGGIATVSEIASLIGAEKLKQLKSECGGLQTLLKNHHQVFLVVQGKVQLRTPILLSDVGSKSKDRVKCKPCWFFLNHPDGCLLNDADCAFKH